MRIVPNKIIHLLVAFLCCNLIFAAPEPPPPALPPVGPGLPIDGSLFLLLALSIILGLYKIKKASR